MSALRGLQRLKPALARQASSSLRSLAAAHEPTPLAKMENPYREPEKGCTLCNVTVDFKNIQLLSQFISPHTGRIYGRHITGLCGRKQREISKAIKKAHSLGFMSVTHKHPQLMKDPNICGIKHLN
ncbi:28S ribosomal protein S18c, mitochondrial [Synchiropus splendidus]|uniref:28S ribosomal protein S18c, mitochondrial n=1 Tax=Synchiropus splendidus TaxID=270530 RepID=UPI00237D6BE5|nr:28S ribosomal protein S18c, mitochondrial [Synchiropus splendidus]XP_053729939.1 28S ribosomal protein S18c, mitochondrial [Synchiropus splendidus]